jgi:hypothetical protein
MLLLRLRYDEQEVQVMTLPSEVFRETGLYRLLLERVRQENEEHIRAELRPTVEQEVRAEAQLAEARRLLITLGTRKLGAPDATALDRVGRLDDPAVVERLIATVLTASSWRELLSPEPEE